MKHIAKYLSAALVAVAAAAFTGCGQKTAAPESAAPKFENASVNTYVKDFTQACNDLVAAYKAKDIMKVASLTPKATELYSKGSDYLKDLKGDEARQFTDWQTKLWTMVSEAASSMASPK